MRSTTELQQRDHSGTAGNLSVAGQARALAARPGNVKHRLELWGGARQGSGMDKKPDRSPREERLAAKLRENLRRRKTQARMLGEDGNAALPKSPPKS